MNDDKTPLPGFDPDTTWGLAPALAAALSPISPAPEQEAGLRARLLDRVARSASANRAFTTVRMPDGHWQNLAQGLQCRHLHADEEACSALLAWHRDEVAWSLPVGAHGHELVVLSGQLQVFAASLHEQPAHALHPHDYLLLRPGVPARLKAPAGTCLYWRRITPGPLAFGQNAPPIHLVNAASADWAPLRQGVRIKPLYAEAERISMLVHFDPGARVPAHSHGHGEACLMVQGDLFLGDVLLRQGDFQFAPRGTDHGELHSDVGCLLFFHGAVDPAVADPDAHPA